MPLPDEVGDVAMLRRIAKVLDEGRSSVEGQGVARPGADAALRAAVRVPERLAREQHGPRRRADGRLRGPHRVRARHRHATADQPVEHRSLGAVGWNTATSAAASTAANAAAAAIA